MMNKEFSLCGLTVTSINISAGKQARPFLHRDNQPSIHLLEKLSFKRADEPGTENPVLACYFLSSMVDAV
jgi:hypothetical protein